MACGCLCVPSYKHEIFMQYFIKNLLEIKHFDRKLLYSSHPFHFPILQSTNNSYMRGYRKKIADHPIFVFHVFQYGVGKSGRNQFYGDIAVIRS